MATLTSLRRWVLGRGACAIALGLAVVLAMGIARAAVAQSTPTTAAGPGEVEIRAEWFGIGNWARPGDWIGIRLDIVDSAERQREVVVRLTLTDADGDQPQYESSITSNPGVNQKHWMYIKLPARFRPTDTIRAQVFTAVEQPAVDAGEARFTAGRLLGSAWLSPRNLLERSDAMIAVVGDREMGLQRYRGLPNTSGLPGAHERAEVLARLDAEALPDRWMGLSPFEVLVWNEPPPTTLGTARAAAVREWVERGGHLVVVLPRVGQTWTDEANNPLFDLVPRVRVDRREAVDLTPYRVLFTRDPRLAMPSAEVVQVFAPIPAATAEEAMPVLAGPGGEFVAVRRLVGTGMVTLIGLDLSSRWMRERGMPEPEMFWHRVLGRRGELVQIREGQNVPQLVDRDPITLDRDIPNQIAKTGRAEVGVLMGLGVFAVYWLVAGPVGYAILRRGNRSQHGWVAFVATAVVFTAVAWGGAAAIRPGRLEATHLTLLDHVYGQPVQRARTWMSLLVPRYGESEITLIDPALPGSARFLNLVAPWEADAARDAAFPDARPYRIESRRPDRLTVPTRSTVKQFQLDWSGGPQWRTPRPVSLDGSDTQPVLLLESEPGKRSESRGDRIVVRGVLTHDLPAALEDVVIIVNRGQKHLTHAFGSGGELLADVAAFKLTSPWRPGEPLDLAPITATDRDTAYFTQLLQSDVGSPEGLQAPDIDRTRVVARLTAIGLLSQLQPPNPRTDETVRRERLARRTSTHTWDLGRWFTQPCVIIIGHVGGGDEGPPTPIPTFVAAGGSPQLLASSGRTVLRWVYPLRADPPIIATSTPNESSPR